MVQEILLNFKREFEDSNLGNEKIELKAADKAERYLGTKYRILEADDVRIPEKERLSKKF